MQHKLVSPLVAVAALFVLAGGFIHLREWLDTYRDLPAAVPGRAVVQIGFPINAATRSPPLSPSWSPLVWKTDWLRLVVAGVALFQIGSLAALVISRNGTLLGWTEPVWTPPPSRPSPSRSAPWWPGRAGRQDTVRAGRRSVPPGRLIGG